MKYQRYKQDVVCMSKKNERYYKVHEEAGQQRRYPIDKNKLDAIDSRFIVQFEGLQGELWKCQLTPPPVWKVCIVRPRSRPRSFDVPYIFYSKFLKSRARNLQTFQSNVQGCLIVFASCLHFCS